MMLGLNLALHDPANAAAYAQAAFGAVPPGLLAAFEIGNEPDLYTQPRTFRVGIARDRARPAAPERLRLRRLPQASSRRCAPRWGPRRRARRSRPAASRRRRGRTTRTTCCRSRGPRPLGFSAHTYAMHTCDRNPHRKKVSFAKALLGPSALAPPVARMAQLAAVASAHGSTFRVSEMNSANCGGVHGASDALASALWGTDMMFALADAGVRGVNFHTFTGAFYAPVDFGLHKGHFAGFVHPLFYAMLLFNRATPQGARLLPVGPNPPTALVQDVGDGRPRGTRRVVVINKSPVKARRLVLRVPGGGGAGARAAARGRRRSPRRAGSRSAGAATATRRRTASCAASGLRARRTARRRVPHRRAARERGARHGRRRTLTASSSTAGRPRRAACASRADRDDGRPGGRRTSGRGRARCCTARLGRAGGREATASPGSRHRTGRIQPSRAPRWPR